MSKPAEVSVYVGKSLIIGVASIEPDPVHRQMLCIRLVAVPVDGTLCLPLADLLIAAEEAKSERVGHA